MAQYENLKDYFQEEHLNLITSAIEKHLKNEVKSCLQIKAPVVRSLVCINDDAQFNVEIELGVSANIVVGKKNCSRSFIITLTGNLEQKFKDINVIAVRSINEDEFPKDNLLWQFILPDLPDSELERIGNELFYCYDENGFFTNDKLCIQSLVEEGMLYFAPLDQNIMGQIILSEFVCEIIHNVHTEHGQMPKIENIRASYGTILLNYNKYAVEYDGEVRVTVAHELVHLMFHGRFLKLLQLLGEENIELNFSTGPFTLAENMTDTQKALCIAEWQADVLAMRLAIPSCTINDNLTIATFKVKNKYEITNRGDRNQACVKELAEIYGVSCIVAKERMRQLGFDFVDGTFNECDGKLMPPFIFPINTLKDNETFVIKSSNYERLLYENKEFADLIYSGRYIYLGYVVCLVDQKYINILINETGLHFQLTNYAREHADECCIKFAVKSGYNKDEKYINYGHTYLYKIDEEPLKQYEACIPDELKTNIDDFAKEDSRLNTMQTYFEVLSYYMFEDNRDTPVQVKDESGYFTHEANNIIKEYEDIFGLSRTMIKRYLNNGSPPILKNAMYICHKLGLNETQSREMLKSAGYYIDAPTPENMVCRLIFRLSYTQADTIFDNWEACVKHFKELTSKSKSLPKL